MWKFKPFSTHKEQTGLEGRIIDIGNFKVQICSAIAEGGFSCVYLARDAINGSKQYALKHIICNDEESQELVAKEVSVMKSLKGHPNVVTLHAYTIFDMGRRKEAFLLMEFCGKSLVNVLENRGAGFFEEKQILTIFRDICNAVFAMHCQSPPIAHRDLKAENLLLGSDGSWKLCDFGSTSTNHKCFEKPEEMGIEEDNIRKHTTPAYRAPEMWDLFRRELINEKVDIWALGCLLFRICYFKLAFDGESKLQVLNGNYRIPDLPKYSTSLTDLIRDMLQSSPDDRPDITQVWFRVNGLFPDGLQKSLPDRPPEMQQNTDVLAGMLKPTNSSSPMPRRSPPPPPSTDTPQNRPSRSVEGTGALGAFWTTQHAKESVSPEEKITPERHSAIQRAAGTEQNFQSRQVQNNAQGRFVNRQADAPAKHSEINLFPDDLTHSSEIVKPSKSEDKELEAEVEKLKDQLACVSTEKAEITSKYEKLSAICRSQRQEIQELKQALAARTPSPTRDSSRNLPSSASQPSTTLPKSQNEKIEGTIWELQQGFFDRRSSSPDPQSWNAFSDDPNQYTTPTNSTSKSVRTNHGQQNKQTAELTPGANNWGFGADNFKAVPTANSKLNVSVGQSNNSQRFGESKSTESKLDSQPAGWAGF